MFLKLYITWFDAGDIQSNSCYDNQQFPPPPKPMLRVATVTSLCILSSIFSDDRNFSVNCRLLHNAFSIRLTTTWWELFWCHLKLLNLFAKAFARLSFFWVLISHTFAPLIFSLLGLNAFFRCRREIKLDFAMLSVIVCLLAFDGNTTFVCRAEFIHLAVKAFKLLSIRSTHKSSRSRKTSNFASRLFFLLFLVTWNYEF